MTDLSHPHQQFIASFRALMDDKPDEARILDEGGSLLAALVSKDDWLRDEFAQPHPDHYQQYLLHLDPAERFSVVSFVWGPGQFTPIHDHTVWGLIGMLRGGEIAESFSRDASGKLTRIGQPITLIPGRVEAVSPTVGDIHRVTNAFSDRVSVSIHVYGADIGQVRRSVYSEEGVAKSFVSGYATPGAKVVDHVMDYASVRKALLARNEIALLDVREEDPFAQEHPLWAANLPLSTIELNAWRRLPRRDVPIVVYGEHDGIDLAPIAMRRLTALGYTDVYQLKDGLEGWRAAGGELFRDVNVPSKSFGELVESERHTPSLSAQEVQKLIDDKEDIAVLDVRRFDEYQTMSIPTATSVPGAELVLRVRDLAPNPSTRIVVNCAGRTRSIIGTQSLVNAGIPNQVAALRNGTIGWTLAGQQLDHGAQRQFGKVSREAHESAARSAREVADRAGVLRATLNDLKSLRDPKRSVYCLDVRTPEEYAAGHLPGFARAPGGQLVQETDHVVPVRGARIVLVDDDGVRANMSASWLAQMGWEVHVLQVDPKCLAQSGPDDPVQPPLPDIASVSPQELHRLLSLPQANDRPVVLDFTASANYVKRHVPGAWFAIRSQLAAALKRVPSSRNFVLTCGTSALARWAAVDLRRILASEDKDFDIKVLEGGTLAWTAAGLPLESGETHLASPRTDRYRRPYEGTDAPREAMQGYLDWEFGLVEQLGRDGTHHFRVI